MAQLGRPGRTATVKEKLWARWKAGESVTEISRAMSVGAKSVRRVLSSNGGCFPRPKKRSSRALSFDERKFIAIGLDDDVSLREISNRIGRSASTVSREIKRHGGRKRCRPVEAEWRAQQLTLRPQPCKLARNPELCALVAQQLAQRWAPQQISGWLKQHFCDNPEMNISHETIYRSLFIQARGALKMELVKHLRSRRSMRRSKDAINDGAGRGQIVDAISIRERPAEVADRAVPGHWEGDLIQGSHNSFIATLVERKTRFVMLARVRGSEDQTKTPTDFCGNTFQRELISRDTHRRRSTLLRLRCISVRAQRWALRTRLIHWRHCCVDGLRWRSFLPVNRGYAFRRMISARKPCP